jgi:hypothetical protein
MIAVFRRPSISIVFVDVCGIVFVGASDMVDPPAAEMDFEIDEHLVDGSEGIDPFLHLLVALDESGMKCAVLFKTRILMFFHVAFFVREVLLDVAIEESECLFDDDEIVFPSSERFEEGIDLLEKLLMLIVKFLIIY